MKICIIIETNSEGESSIDSVETYYMLADKRVRFLRAHFKNYGIRSKVCYKKYDLSSVDLTELLKQVS